MSILKLLKRTFLVFSLTILAACNSNVFYQSNAFYINDSANALLSSTQYLIYLYSKELDLVDSQTKEYRDNRINGTQVVVATYLGEPDSVDTTEIYNNWKIGNNDLGFLLFVYFEASNTEEYAFNYLGMTWEIGDNLSSYISMTRVEQIYQETWNSPSVQTNHPGDYDYWLTAFYVGILQEIYLKVYEYTSFAYTVIMDNYEENQYNSYFNSFPKGNNITYNFPWYVWVIIAIIGLILILSGKWWYLLFFISPGSSHHGGGGSSGGYRYTKR